MHPFKKMILSIVNEVSAPGVYYEYGFSATGRTSASLACDETTFPTSLFSSASSITSGIRVFTESALTNPFVGYGLWYQYGADGVSMQIDSSGYISNITSCSIGPSPEPYYNINLSNSTPYLACSSSSIPSTYPLSLYAVRPFPILGDIIHNNSGLSSPFLGDGTYYWISLAFGYQINSSGEVIGVIDCS